MSDLAFYCFQYALALLLAPLLPGIIARVKAKVAGRHGKPVLQLYFDIVKGLRKGEVISHVTTPVFTLGPVVGLATVLCALALLPLGGMASPLRFSGDFLLAAYLLGLGRFLTMLAALDTVVARAQKKAREKNSNQISLLAMAPQVETRPQPGIGFDCPESGIPEMDEDQRLKNEKEALGFFLTSHPLQPFSREMRRLRLTTLEDARDLYPKAELSTAVLVVSLKEVITKSKGERMAFVGVEDLTGHAEVTFFPRAYAEARELLKSEQPLCLRATVDSQVDESRDSDEDGEETSREVKLLGQSVTLLSEACGQSDTPICVQIPAHRLGDEDILALKAILEAHPGTVEAEAMILLDGVRCHLTLGPQFRVSPGPELDRALAAWAG